MVPRIWASSPRQQVRMPWPYSLFQFMEYLGPWSCVSRKQTASTDIHSGHGHPNKFDHSLKPLDRFIFDTARHAERHR